MNDGDCGEDSNEELIERATKIIRDEYAAKVKGERHMFMAAFAHWLDCSVTYPEVVGQVLWAHLHGEKSGEDFTGEELNKLLVDEVCSQYAAYMIDEVSDDEAERICA